MTWSSVPVHPRRYIEPLTSGYGPARGGRRVGRSGVPGHLPGNRPRGLPSGTLADGQSHAENRLSAREPFRSPRMRKPALAPGPNTGQAGRSSGWVAAGPPVVRVCSRAAGRAGSVGVCCLSSRARGGAVRTGARSATTPARDPGGLTGACAGVASPASGTRPVRSPPLARSPRGVRTPALTLCALLRPARRWVPRRTSVAHLP
jgi:hypothetical protein